MGRKFVLKSESNSKRKILLNNHDMQIEGTIIVSGVVSNFLPKSFITFIKSSENSFPYFWDFNNCFGSI